MIDSPTLALIFLIGSSLMTGISTAIQRIGKAQSEQIAKNQLGFGKFLFKKADRDLLAYAFILTKNALLICFTITAFDFTLHYLSDQSAIETFLLALVIVLCSFMISDYIFRILSVLRPRTFFKMTCQIGSLILIIFWPLAILLYKILHCLLPVSKETTTFLIKDKILEILHDSEFAPYLDPNDQKLILSVISFKERIAREVMVPRIDMYTLNSSTSIQNAAKEFLKEGYSRIPVWKENVDNIIGTLYYKDLFRTYFNASEKDLDSAIEHLLKPIVYAPETKKISQLLQEFRTKQIHLAIVVDEYGGTEGIVTIEDILEQLVGEIGDEYDWDEEALFTVLPSGGWIVDAKMSILDIESELGIAIPQSPEYDTVGGYIFHKAGSIPSKGWRLHQDDFELEVLSSSERTIEKIKIAPH